MGSGLVWQEGPYHCREGVGSVRQRAIPVRGAVLRHSRSQLGTECRAGTVALRLAVWTRSPEHHDRHQRFAPRRHRDAAEQPDGHRGAGPQSLHDLAPALGSPPAPRPVNVGYITQTNTNARVNSFLGFDAQRRAAVTVFAQGMLDDIQIDRKSALDLKPSSYGLTVGAQGSLPRFNGAWTFFYTRVTNLTYRNENNFETPIYFGLGTGRNFSDYDQATLRASFMAPAPTSILLTPEVTLLRQGEGDPHLPHPPVSAYP